MKSSTIYHFTRLCKYLSNIKRKNESNDTAFVPVVVISPTVETIVVTRLHVHFCNQYI